MALSPERKRYATIMTMIGSGHALSHFYLLSLPPLFLLLKAEFATSYAALGLLLTAFNLAAGSAQVPAGFLVDRFGARRVLVAGLVISGFGIGLIGLAPDYRTVLALVLIAGIGVSVFHPADYAIINASIDPRRLGRAFALHTFTGNVGFVIAPVTMIFLSSLWGWRVALWLAGAAAFPLAVVYLRYGALLGGALLGDAPLDDAPLDDGPGPAAEKARDSAGLKPLLAPAVLTLFAFFVCVSMITGGIQAFSVTALVTYHGTGLAVANSILTGFLLASACGVLLGGHLADRTSRHGLVVALALAGSAALLLLVGGARLPAVALMVVFVAIGLLQGSVRPSRDMMVRAATPKGASGRVFAFVSAGLNLGAAVTPVLFGYLIDLGHAQWVFILMAVILLLAIGTVGIARGQARPAPLPAE